MRWQGKVRKGREAENQRRKGRRHKGKYIGMHEESRGRRANEVEERTRHNRKKIE